MTFSGTDFNGSVVWCIEQQTIIRNDIKMRARVKTLPICRKLHDCGTQCDEFLQTDDLLHLTTCSIRSNIGHRAISRRTQDDDRIEFKYIASSTEYYINEVAYHSNVFVGSNFQITDGVVHEYRLWKIIVLKLCKRDKDIA